MFGTKWLAKSVAGMIIGFAGLVAANGAASAAVLTIETVGLNTPGAPAGTLVQRVDLAAAGLTTINTIVLRDISGGIGGDAGIFSGYDIDAVFLDADGDLNTAGDRVFLSSFVFSGGDIRPGAGPLQQPDPVNNYGDYFGTNAAGNVGPFGPGGTKNATLNLFDGINISDRLNANGYLSMGDNGVLTLTFADILVSNFQYLIFGEVGGQGEALQVEVPGQVPLPGAVWLFLSAIAVLFGFSRRRSMASA